MSAAKTPDPPPPAPAPPDAKRRRPAGSLSLRLLVGAAAWIAAALAAAGWMIAGLFADHVARRLDAELTGHLNQLAAALTVRPDGETVVDRPLSDPRFSRPLSGLYWRVETPDGKILRSRSLWDGDMQGPPPPVAEEEAAAARRRPTGPGGAPLIALERAVLPLGATERVRLTVGADAAELTAATAAFNKPLIWSLLILWGALTAAATAQVKIGLRPLGRLSADLADVRAGRVARLPQDVPVEVAPVAAALNAVLDHDAAVVARARLEAGNLAHALKTDLAILSNDAQRLAQAGTATSAEAADIALLTARMTRQIDRHMARARAAASVGATGARTPVKPCVDRLLRAMTQLYADRGPTPAGDAPAGLQFHGDAEDLTEMLGNLLDNACKHAARRATVAVEATGDGFIRVVVSDDGPGLPPQARAAALKAGVRLDENGPGAGLGLAVTLDLATLYGGGLTLEDADGGGLAAVLRLPGGPA